MIYIYLLKIMRGFLIFSFVYKSKQNLRVKRLKTYRNHEIKEITKITNSNIIQTSFSTTRPITTHLKRCNFLKI